MYYSPIVISHWITHGTSVLCCIFLVLSIPFMKEFLSMSALTDFYCMFETFYMDPIILFVLQVSHTK